jgi:hypothetical protein
MIQAPPTCLWGAAISGGGGHLLRPSRGGTLLFFCPVSLGDHSVGPSLEVHLVRPILCLVQLLTRSRVLGQDWLSGMSALCRAQGWWGRLAVPSIAKGRWTVSKRLQNDTVTDLEAVALPLPRLQP